MEMVRSLTVLALALALWWVLAVTGNALLFPTPAPDQPATSWALVFQPLYASVIAMLPPLLLGLIAPRWSVVLAIAFGVAVALLEQRTRHYQLAPASLLGSSFAHVIEAIVAALAGMFVTTRIPPNTSFRPKPLRRSA